MKPLAQNTLIQNRYLIVHLIGKGGMGEVYLSVDQRLGSAVALKRTYFKGDEMLGGAFEREAKILARLRHPVLPKVSDHFSENDDQFLVMEHISGDDLAKRLESAQKPFPLSWVMFWADQLLDALSYLHAHEPPIIHRDIKPQNLKLTDENHVILLDFGLSKSSAAQTQTPNSGSTGSVVGYTPHFAPMEQIRGFGTDARSDVYSLSATLYQLMTNQVPADALTRADAILNDLPDPIEPPHKLNVEIPSAVSEIILKGMELSQDKRYGTAREMQKLLRRAFTEMHDAMSAKTVVFNMKPEEGDAIDQPEGISLPREGGDSADNISIPTTVGTQDAPDMEATMAFEQGEVANVAAVPRQADVKTEVFLATDNVFDAPAPFVDAPPNNGSPDSRQADFLAENGASAAAPPIPDHFPSTDIAEQPNAYATVAVQREEAIPEWTPPLPTTPVEIPVESPKKAETAVAVQPKKKSSGKAFAIFGGLFALIVLALGAAGGGWYYYNNFYAVVPPAPSPSPEPSLIPSPTAEPTIESSSVTTETNTNSEAQTTVSPTPEERTDVATEPNQSPSGPSTSKPVATSPGKTTPARPTGKPTQKPKKDNDRTIILQ